MLGEERPLSGLSEKPGLSSMTKILPLWNKEREVKKCVTGFSAFHITKRAKKEIRRRNGKGEKRRTRKTGVCVWGGVNLFYL